MQFRLALALPREALSIPVSRRVMSDTLRTMGVTDECINDIALALSEACTNVLDHAIDGDDYEIVAGIDGTVCIIDVVDRGAGFDSALHGHADALPDAETGRGIQLMRRLVDSVQFRSETKGGTVVHLVKQLEWKADSPIAQRMSR